MRNTKHPISSSERDLKRRHEPSPGTTDDNTPPKWSARILRKGALTGPASVELTFPTRGGGEVNFAPRTVKSGRNTLVEDLSNYLPIFPSHVGANRESSSGVHPQARGQRANRASAGQDRFR